LKLLIAAYKGNLKILQLLHSMSIEQIQINFPHNTTNPFPQKTQHGFTLLQLAARGGYKNIIEELIKEQALDYIDINDINNFGDSALHLAILSKNIEFIKFFVGLVGLDKSKGIEITLALLAASDENFEIFVEFYDIYSKSGPRLELNNQLMKIAAVSNCPRILKAMLESPSINVNYTNMLNQRNGTQIQSYTALHHALQHKNETMVRDILAVPGINVIYYTENVTRPVLSLACALPQSTFALILEHSLAQLTNPGSRSEFFRRQYSESHRVGAPNSEPRTLLADAIRSNEITKVNSILPYTPAETIQSEINTAIRTNNLEIFLALLRPSLPVDATIIQKKMFFQTTGHSFLYNAAFHGSDKIAEWLLDNEAEVDASDDENRTPLFAAIAGNSLDHYPAATRNENQQHINNTANQICFLKSSPYSLKSGHIAVISELHARGAAFDITLADDSNVLHYAVQHRRMKTLEFLLQLEPRLSLLSERADGDSALSLAIQSPNFPNKYIISSLLPKLTKTQLRDVEVQTHLLNATSHLSLIKEMHAKFKFNLQLKLPDGDYLIHYAARQKTSNMIKYLLENKCNANTRNEKGETPLYVALSTKQAKPVITALLKAKASNAVSNDDSTMMHAIARGGRIDVLKLVERKLKLDVNAKDQLGRTPLFYVANAFITRELIARGAEVNWVDANKETPLHNAFRGKDPKLINTILESIASKDFATVVNQANKEGVTVLHFAAEHHLIGFIEILVRHGGIDLDAVQHNQQTAMTIAANKGHWDTVKLLVEAKASVSAEVLYCAAKAGNKEMVEFLLTPIYESNGRRKQRKVYEGIDPNVLHEGWSPLHIAANFNHVEVIAVLLAHGANIDLLNENNVTALYLACQFGKLEAVRLLLEHGANIDIVCNGSLAIQVASTLEHKEIYNLLSKKKLDQISLQAPMIQSSSSSSSAITSFNFFVPHLNGEAKQEIQNATTAAKKPKTQHSPSTQSSASFFTLPEEADVEMAADPKQLPAKRRNSETEAATETEEVVQPKKAKSETSETEQRREREREIGGGDRSYLLDPNL
jgi:ankyrin repeat protein